MLIAYNPITCKIKQEKKGKAKNMIFLQVIKSTLNWLQSKTDSQQIIKLNLKFEFENNFKWKYFQENTFLHARLNNKFHSKCQIKTVGGQGELIGIVYFQKISISK